MERITRNDPTGPYIPYDLQTVCLVGSPEVVPSGKYMGRAIDKLAYYEDLAEQGRLIELPCAVGDVVYDIGNGEVCTTRVLRFVMFGDGRVGCRTVSGFPDVQFFGDTVFVSSREADAALAVKGWWF